MLRPDLFAALASHAGDTLYELCYLADFGDAARALRAYDHDIEAWWADFHARVPMSKPEDGLLLGLYGVAACFSPGPDGAPLLPFEPRTGAPVDEVWRRWLAWDPVRMIDGHAEALRSLRAVWLDAGTRDEYRLDLGTQAFCDGLERIGVPDGHIHFELFDAGHGGIDYRYPLSLRWLAERLSR
jgi:hypothetical protein